jgi:CelD/BcsL family acetyltransferase involved in cellulose biosynthesis
VPPYNDVIAIKPFPRVELNVKLEYITTDEAFCSLHSEWNALLSTNATNEIFLTWEWQYTWWQTYQPGDLWIIAARDDDQNVIGIAPLYIERTSQIVRFIGGVEVTDYVDVLVRPEMCEAFFAQLVDFLVTHGKDYRCLTLSNIPGETPTLEVLTDHLTARGFNVMISDEDVCPAIVLPTDFETYLSQLDKKQRHELRRKVRRAEDNPDDEVAWYIVGPQHDLDAEIERFLHLMMESHPEKARFLQESHHKDFFKSIIPQLAACGWLQLSFLTINGEAAATYLNFDYNNRIFVYNSGLLPSKYAHLSPGIVLLVYNIQRAIEQGREVFDFLQGNEDYKYRMGAQDRPVKTLEATF